MIRSVFETNKVIPPKYREVILEVLEKYPELKYARIRFRLEQHYPVPYGTSAWLSTVFRSPEKRAFTVTLRERAKQPLEQVLFHNLTRDMQKGVLAHQMAHALQLRSKSSFGLLKLMCGFVSRSVQRTIEREADKVAAERGFDRELYEYAQYIRTVPGYVQEHSIIQLPRT